MPTNTLEYFYLYKKPNLEETAGIPSQDLMLYKDEDFNFDMYLSHIGCYRADSKIHFHKPMETGEAVWDIFSKIKDFLETNNYYNEFFVHTGVSGACIIQLTNLKQNK
jgi:hypothetical protein